MSKLILVLLAICSVSCMTVRKYEMINLNDPDMILSAKKIERFETAFQVYREGAAGANGGKTGGGCGCN